jgi:hypothetical protein
MLPISTLIHAARIAAGLTVLDVARRIVPDPADEDHRCWWVDCIDSIEGSTLTAIPLHVDAIATALDVDTRTRRLWHIATRNGGAAVRAATGLLADDVITAVPSATPERMRAALRVLRGEERTVAAGAFREHLRAHLRANPLPVHEDFVAEHAAFEPRDSDAKPAITINVDGGIFDEASFLRVMERSLGGYMCTCGHGRNAHRTEDGCVMIVAVSASSNSLCPCTEYKAAH